MMIDDDYYKYNAFMTHAACRRLPACTGPRPIGSSGQRPTLHGPLRKRGRLLSTPRLLQDDDWLELERKVPVIASAHAGDAAARAAQWMCHTAALAASEHVRAWETRT